MKGLHTAMQEVEHPVRRWIHEDAGLIEFATRHTRNRPYATTMPECLPTHAEAHITWPPTATFPYCRRCGYDVYWRPTP